MYNRPMDGMSHDVCVTFVPNQIQDRPALRGRGMDRGRGRGAPAHGPIGRGHVTLTSAPNRRRSRSVSWSHRDGPKIQNASSLMRAGGFLKWWVSPTNPWVFLLKTIILGCFEGTTILGNPQLVATQMFFENFYPLSLGREKSSSQLSQQKNLLIVHEIMV